LTLELPSGLILRECTYHRAATGAEGIGLPGKPQLDRDGRQRKDATGKALFTPIVELKGKVARERSRPPRWPRCMRCSRQRCVA